MSHVTVIDCERMGRLVEEGVQQVDIAEEYGIAPNTVGYHVHGHCTHDTESAQNYRHCPFCGEACRTLPGHLSCAASRGESA